MNITESQKKKLEYFVGKVVTLLVPPINRNLDDNGMLSYFLGRITEIDEAGIWYTHLETGCKNFIFFNHVIALAEEIVVENNGDKNNDADTNSTVLPKTVAELSKFI